MSQPTLSTPRLCLRPLCTDDATAVHALAGDRAIAETTLNIPHPYEEGMAEAWIASLEPGFENGALATFAVIDQERAELVGAAGLRTVSGIGELGYWIGRPFWGQGYATEAAIAILEYGFCDRSYQTIGAGHFAENTASGRVMQKAGMQFEKTVPEAATKWGRRVDVVRYVATAGTWKKPLG